MRTFRLFLAPILFWVLSVTVSDGEALPRVLIIGDSIYREPAANVSNELKGLVEVVHATTDSSVICNTWTALEKLDAWLGAGEWDLIHFNFGLGDLVYRVPGIKAFRVYPMDAGGVLTTKPEEYEKNLQELVKRLKATKAKLIWASTTPIRHSTTMVFEMNSEIKYNIIAAKVMTEHKIPTNDMYQYVFGLIDMNKPASHGADPFFFDRKPIHGPIVKIIKREFGLGH